MIAMLAAATPSQSKSSLSGGDRKFLMAKPLPIDGQTTHEARKLLAIELIRNRCAWVNEAAAEGWLTMEGGHSVCVTDAGRRLDATPLRKSGKLA